MTKSELKARIRELAAKEQEALDEKDTIRFRDMRGKRNVLEERLSAL
jgi:hypothetical protein